MGELGSWLVRAREAKGLTLEDAERDTRISRRYLQALETEQFDIIPAPVYARGFLRSYSQYLGLDPQEVLALFPREDQYPGSTRTEARATPDRPLPAQSPSRPSWRREPEPRRPVAPPPSRAPSRQPFGGPPPRQQQPRADYYDDYDDGRQQYDARYDEPRRPAAQYPEERFEAPRRPAARYAEEQYPERPSFPRPVPADSYDEHPPRPRARYDDHFEDEPYDPSEPMIGVDIGVPAPARRIRTDPAAQTRTAVVAIVAIGTVLGVILLALMIANLGSDDSTPDIEAPPADDTALSEDVSTPPPASGGAETSESGPPRGIVPDVVGLDIAVARDQVEAAGYVVNEVHGPNAAPVGEVFGQVPVGNTHHPEGDMVTLAVSEGP